MLEVVQYVLGNFWHWAGATITLYIVALALAVGLRR